MYFFMVLHHKSFFYWLRELLVPDTSDQTTCAAGKCLWLWRGRHIQLWWGNLFLNFMEGWVLGHVRIWDYIQKSIILMGRVLSVFCVDWWNCGTLKKKHSSRNACAEVPRVGMAHFMCKTPEAQEGYEPDTIIGTGGEAMNKTCRFLPHRG